MSKFAAGEIAVLLKGTSYAARPFTRVIVCAGDEVVIHRVGPFANLSWATQPNALGAFAPGDNGYEYEILHPSGYYFFCHERHLGKRPHRGLPDSVTTIFKQPRAVEA